MRTFILLVLALTWGSSVELSASALEQPLIDSLDTQKDMAWRMVREPGTFAPAGWASVEVPALTRVQAVRMGLRIDEWVDERFDPIKGKAAAASYYQTSIALESPVELVAQEGGMLLSDIADEANAPLRVIEKANPHLRRDVLPRGVSLYGTSLSLEGQRMKELAVKQEEYQKSLAVQYNKRRTQVLSFMPDPSTHSAITYTVRSGDYLGRISSKTGASVAQIQKWNRIKGNTIYPGQKLTVWVPKKAQESVQNRVAATPAKEEAPKTNTVALVSETAQPSTDEYITYEVKEGDTLWGIAQKFPGVSADQIKTWNKVDALIKAGEKLKISTQTISDYSPDKYPSTL